MSLGRVIFPVLKENNWNKKGNHTTDFIREHIEICYVLFFFFFVDKKSFLCACVKGKNSKVPPAVVTPLGYPELTVTVETMRGHVVRHPPRDLQTHTFRWLQGEREGEKTWKCGLKWVPTSVSLLSTRSQLPSDSRSSLWLDRESSSGLLSDSRKHVWKRSKTQREVFLKHSQIRASGSSAKRREKKKN